MVTSLILRHLHMRKQNTESTGLQLIEENENNTRGM